LRDVGARQAPLDSVNVGGVYHHPPAAGCHARKRAILVARHGPEVSPQAVAAEADQRRRLRNGQVGPSPGSHDLYSIL